MKLNTKSTRFFMVPSISLLALGVLAGCGSNENANDSVTESPTSSSATVSSSTAAESSEATASPTDSPVPSSSSSSSAEAEGNTVVAEKNKISFTVPEGWDSINLATVDYSAPDAQELLQQFATSSNITVEELEAQMKEYDLSVYDTGVDGTEIDNITVAAQPVAAAALPTEQDTLIMIQSMLSAIPGAYSTFETPLGEGASQAYTTEIVGRSLNNQLLIVPSGMDKSFTVLTVTSSGDVQAIADQIISSLKKA